MLHGNEYYMTVDLWGCSRTFTQMVSEALGLLFMLLLLPQSAVGVEALAISTAQPYYGLGHRVQYLEDEIGKLTLAEVLSPTLSPDWRDSDAETPSFGVTSSTYWFAIRLFNDNRHVTNWLLEIGNPTIDMLELYILSPSNLAKGGYQQRFYGGNRYSFSQREREDPHFVFPISLEPKQVTWLYLRVRNAYAMKLPLGLWQEEAYNSHRQVELMVQSAYFGIMAIMALYNLFVYFSLRDKSYLYYVMFVVSFSSWMFIEKGLAFQYIWPNGVWQNLQLYVVTSSMAAGTSALFANEFLSLEKNHPAYYRILYYLSLVWAFVILCAFVFPAQFMLKLIVFIALPGGMLLLLAGLLMWKKGVAAARYYAIAWSAVIIGSMFYALSILGLIPSNTFTTNAFQVGSVLEVFLLSLGLANRINTFQKEKEVAQQESLTLKARMQEVKFNLQQNINKELEGRVQERTLKLEATLAELSKANRQLKTLSTTDGLTDVMNRRYFEENYPKEWKRGCRDQSPLSIIVVDIDYFKKVNDTYGHSAGDECLKVVASTIKGLVQRPADAVSRFGGEEFVITLPNTDASGVRYLAENIRTQIESLSIEIPGHCLQLTISLGVATTIPRVENESAALFNLADSALYEAKDSGRNQVVARQSI